ncbi:unnamed protein product [Sympodiomycopsis kandeliae]
MPNFGIDVTPWYTQLSQPAETGVKLSLQETVINHSAYQPSADAQNTGKKFKVDYLSNQGATGYIWLDSLSIAGASLHNVQIYVADKDFLEKLGPIVGLAGLGLPQEGNKEGRGFLSSLFASGHLDAHIVSFSFGDRGGRLAFGDISGGAQANPVWQRVIPNGHGAWYINVKINNLDIKAIIDTGSAAVIAPKKQARELFRSLPNVEIREKDETVYAVLKSDDPGLLPHIFLQVGAHSFRLSKHAILYQQDDDGKAALSITGQDAFKDNTWVIGALILQDFVTVLDWDARRVGLIASDDTQYSIV